MKDDGISKPQQFGMGSTTTTSFSVPERSEWKCHLFGSGAYGIVWNPAKGEEPNRFWRWMQYLAFGNKWTREPR